MVTIVKSALNKQTKRELAQARAEIKSGKIKTLSQVKKEMRM